MTMFSDQVQYFTFSCRSVGIYCTVGRIVPIRRDLWALSRMTHESLNHTNRSQASFQIEFTVLTGDKQIN